MGILYQIRFAIRMIIKNRLVSLIAIFSLALGIAANTMIFSVVEKLLFTPLPVRDQAKLVSIYTTDIKNPGKLQVSYLTYLDYQAQQDVFEGILAYRMVPLGLMGREHPERIVAAVVSGNYFKLLGVTAFIGRTLTEQDSQLNAPPAVVLSYDAWQARFAGNANIIGSVITLNSTPFTVVGVAHKGFIGTELPPGPELWMPLMAHAQITPEQMEKYQNRRYLLLNAIARMKPGVEFAQARSALAVVAAHEARDFPNDNQGRGVDLVRLNEARMNPDGKWTLARISVLLMSVVAIVLLIACANVASLLLARFNAREKEISIRLSVGASRGDLLKQLLTESCVLSLVGGGIGLVLVWIIRDFLDLKLPGISPELFKTSLDIKVLLFTLCISLLSGLVFGLTPAIYSSKPTLSGLIKGRASSDERQRTLFHLQKVLIVMQMSLCLVSITVAGMFIKSLVNAHAIDPGFVVDKVALLQFDVSFSRYDDEKGKTFYKELISRVESLPGVQAASIATDRPFAEPLRRTVFLEGDASSSQSKGILVRTSSVTPDYFSALGIRLKQGRNFTLFDNENSSGIAIVNEAMANLFWPGEDPIGKQIKLFRDTRVRQVVGVTTNANSYRLGEDPQPFLYIPFLQNYYPGATLYVRTSNNAQSALASVLEKARELDPAILVMDARTMRDLIDQSLWQTYVTVGLLTGFGMIALVLACIGIYGLMSFFVTRRTHEIGIRMALGAQSAQILRFIFRQGLALLIVGLVLGIGITIAAARLMTGMLFGVKMIDIQSMVFGALVLTAVAVLAIYVPARRALKIDPLRAVAAE